MKKRKLVINRGKLIKWSIFIANLVFISVVYKSSQKYDHQVKNILAKDDLEEKKLEDNVSKYILLWTAFFKDPTFYLR